MRHQKPCRYEEKTLDRGCLLADFPKTGHIYSPSILNKGRCIKISSTGVDQKLNYNCSKFSEPFTKLQIWSVKGPKYFQRLYIWPSVDIHVRYSHRLSLVSMGCLTVLPSGRNLESPRDQGTSWDSPRGPLTQLSLSPLGMHGTTLGVPSHSSVPTVRPIPKSPRDARDVMGLPWGSPHTAPSLLSVPSLSPLGMQGTSWDYHGGPLTQLSLSPLGMHGTTLGVPSHSSVPTVCPILKSPRDARDVMGLP